MHAYMGILACTLICDLFWLLLFIQIVHCGSSVGKDNIDVSSSIRGNHLLKIYCLHSSQPGLVPVFVPGEIKPDKSTPANDNYHIKNGMIHHACIMCLPDHETHRSGDL